MAVLVDIFGRAHTGMLIAVLLDGLGLAELGYQSKTVEYLYKNLEAEAYKGLIAFILQDMEN